MTTLYGRTYTRRDLERRSANPLAAFGVQLLTLGDGAERGVRLLEFRTGTGLVFRVMIDRGFDIGTMEYQGTALGWQSATGFRHPGLHETTGEGGLSWLRSFSGFLATCGLDHAFGPVTEDGTHYNYPGRRTVEHGLHGRAAYLPATLSGYGARWEGDRCVLWAEGRVVQATVFGETLELLRRYEVEAGTNRVRLFDTVTNRGFSETPHMMLYHLNLGWPLLDEGAQLLAPIRRVLAATHGPDFRRQGVGYRTAPKPQPGFVEQVWDHEVAADRHGYGVYALLNAAHRGGIGLVIEARLDTLPRLVQWQAFAEGIYALGIEPGTNGIEGRAGARERGTLVHLAAGESRSYELFFDVCNGAEALEETRRRIEGIHAPPQEEYPAVGA